MKTDLYRGAAYLIIGLAILIGGGSLAIFMAFLYTGSLNIIDLGMDTNAALWLDSSLCLLFFVQHSSMIRAPFRRWLEHFIPAPYHGALFAISSGTVLLVLVVFWQDSGQVVVNLEGAYHLLLRLLFILSIAGLLWSAYSLRAVDFTGKDQILATLHNRQLAAMPFSVRGPYRCVRHPIYFFTLLLIWSCPDISLDRLLFNGLWSSWIVIGTVLEERDLVAAFGVNYRNYQKNVPMLIPWRACSKYKA